MGRMGVHTSVFVRRQRKDLGIRNLEEYTELEDADGEPYHPRATMQKCERKVFAGRACCKMLKIKVQT